MGLEHKLFGPHMCPWCWGFVALQMWNGGIQAAWPDKWSHGRWKGVLGESLVESCYMAEGEAGPQGGQWQESQARGIPK